MNGHGDGDGAGTGTGVEVNEGARDGNGDGSGDVAGTGAGTGVGTGVGTRRRTPDWNGDGDGDGDGDGSEDSSGDGNGDGDNGSGNENRIGESGREAKKRKRPQNSRRRRAGTGGDTGGKRKKCRKERIDSVAANPNDLKSNKEAGGGAEGTQGSSRNCSSRESVSPLSRLIRGFRNQVSLIASWEDQCEWHRMTRMTGPDCAVMCNLINTQAHTYTLVQVERVCPLCRA